MEEFLYFVRHKQLLRRYFGGSAAEGTNLSTSDIDKMIVARCICVCSNPADAKNVRGHVFLVDSQDSSQGYAKLVLLKSEKESLYFQAKKSYSSGLNFWERDRLQLDPQNHFNMALVQQL